MSAALESVRNADSLAALRDALSVVARDEQGLEYDRLLSELPTFGGEELAQEGIYSWDETHVLVDGASGWELMAREELA